MMTWVLSASSASFGDAFDPLAQLAVVRMHGRNESGWEAKTVHERFSYHYDHRELGEWVERVAKLADEADRTHVIMNNCYRDYAQSNARELAELLRGNNVSTTSSSRRRGVSTTLAATDSTRSTDG